METTVLMGLSNRGWASSIYRVDTALLGAVVLVLLRWLKWDSERTASRTMRFRTSVRRTMTAGTTCRRSAPAWRAGTSTFAQRQQHVEGCCVKRLPLFLAGTLASCCSAPAYADPCDAPLPAQAGVRFSGTVRYIGDGDSLCVGKTTDPNEWIEIRLAVFDAPELHQALGAAWSPLAFTSQSPFRTRPRPSMSRREPSSTSPSTLLSGS